MENQIQPDDFKEVLKLPTATPLPGSYAEGYHGHPRTTTDMNVRAAMNPSNAENGLMSFTTAACTPPFLFMKQGNIVRMGISPVRIELPNEIDGMESNNCYRAASRLKPMESRLKKINLSYLRNTNTYRAISRT